MDRQTFQQYSAIIRKFSGITLRDGKESLITSRIVKRLRSLGLPDHRAYLEHVLHDDTGEEIVHLIDAVATNVTSFFREPAHFEALAEFIRQEMSRGKARFRIWSAACSSGEEPYSLAMTLLDAAGGRPFDARILATDLSTRVLATAEKGVYPVERLANLPPRYLERYFRKVQGAGPSRFRLRDEPRSMVVYRRLNLACPPFPMRGPFDAIFCRNVMIYFDDDVRRRLLDELARLLRPGGYLFTGHAETLNGLLDEFAPVGPSIYRLLGPGERRAGARSATS